ncbi:MAG: hypothetical protein DME09_17185 [Candidatus Rokuibacteriota bacterium]|nr:MAG: hypothetical protein DME09_17185 [Candidatus Rokubacteria bacterium]
MTDWIVLRGAAAPPPRRTALQAGPLSLDYETGALRRIRLGDREVLRQVYVAVRDPDWDTIEPVISDLRIDAGGDRFELTFTARHVRDTIDYTWRGRVTGDAQGAIRFSMDGIANRTFKKNRIGFCVLHPPQCAGAPVELLTADGAREARTFPRAIAPSQPFRNLRGLAHEVGPGLTAEVRFDGDTFETEDHRNWTDASFKTYCTPLSLPRPVEVRAGERIAQAVTLILQGAVPAVGAAAPSGSVTVSLGETGAGPLPRLGLGLASHGWPLSAREARRLRALGLSHLRVDLPLAERDLERRLARAAVEARALSVPLEAALFLTEAAEEELGRLGAALDRLDPPVGTWLIFHVAELSTTEKWVQLARPALKGARPAALIGTGTNAYFTELNRGRPPIGAVDLVSYSLNPQVHAFDDASLVENLEGQRATVESAREFIGDRRLAVSPVTLRPRLSPNGEGPAPAPVPGELPSQVDPRQMSLFGAAWTVGSLRNLAEAGVYSVTYYETTGWRGVMETDLGSPLPHKFPSRLGRVFPVYHVLADVGAFAGGTVMPTRSSDPLRAQALAVRKDGRTRVLVVNLAPEPQRLTLVGLPAPVSLRVLDQSNAEWAAREPESFRRERGKEVDGGHGRLEVELGPYAVTTLDYPAV